MLRDITIGQYFPGHSFIHKMDPRMKIIAAVLYIVVLFVASRPLGLALGIAIVVLMYAVSKISPKMVVKSLKPVVPIILFDAEKLSPRNRVRFLSIRYLRSSSVHSLSPMPDLSPAPTTL